MKKYLILTLVVVMVLGVSLTSTAYYDETDTYLDRVVNEADIIDTGNAIGYTLGLTDDLTTHYIEGEYFVGSDTYVSFTTYFNENSDFGDNISAIFGHEFYNKEEWIASFNVAKSYNDNLYTFIRTDKRLNEKVTLHNNLRLAFLDNYTGKGFSSGFTYDLQDNNSFKLAFVRDGYAKEIENIADDVILKAALKTKLSKEYNNVVYIENNFGDDNISFTEQVIYNPARDFYLDAAITFNTEDHNEFSIESEKKIRDNLYFTGDYNMILDLEDEYHFNLGFVYKF